MALPFGGPPSDLTVVVSPHSSVCGEQRVWWQFILHALHFVRCIILGEGQVRNTHLSSPRQNPQGDKGDASILAYGVRGCSPWPFGSVASEHSILAKGTCGPQWLTSLKAGGSQRDKKGLRTKPYPQ